MGTRPTLVDGGRGPRVAASLGFRLLRWPEDAAQIEDAWRSLEERVPALHYQRFDWYRVTIEMGPPVEWPARGRTGPYREWVGVARQGDRVVAVLPVRHLTQSVSGIPQRMLALPRDDHFTCDWLLDVEGPAPDVVARFAGFLQAQKTVRWDCLFLEKIPEGAGIVRSLTSSTPPRTIVDPAERADVLPCKGTHEQFLEGLSRNFRANLRKARNRLGSTPGVEFHAYCAGPGMDAALEEFARIESSGWKAREGGAGILTSPEGHERFRRRSRVLMDLGLCRVNLLSVEGKTIAGQWSAVDSGTVYLLKIGYDESFARLAPGNMLLEWLIRRSIRDPSIRRIDLASDASWHADWRPRQYTLSNVCIFNKTLRGRLACAATRLKLRLRARRAAHRDGAEAGSPREW